MSEKLSKREHKYCSQPNSFYASLLKESGYLWIIFSTIRDQSKVKFPETSDPMGSL